jgi:hypothetical protein
MLTLGTLTFLHRKKITVTKVKRLTADGMVALKRFGQVQSQPGLHSKLLLRKKKKERKKERKKVNRANLEKLFANHTKQQFSNCIKSIGKNLTTQHC